MPNKNEILEIGSVKFSFDDIHQVIKKFYARVEVDPNLRAPFSVVDDWPHHIERLTHFWWIRFGGSPYMDVSYNPIQKHFETGFSEILLAHWLDLFKNVMIENLTPPQVQIWSDLAGRIGSALNYNNELMLRHHKKR